jgi:hypothetical protein
MHDRCPYCEKEAPAGSVVCPNCGSQLIHVDDKKTTWHLYALPILLTAALVGTIAYFQIQMRKAEEAAANAPVVRTVNKALNKQLEDQEARASRVMGKRKSIQDAREKRARDVEADEKWRAMTPDAQLEYLTSNLKMAELRLVRLEDQSHGEQWAQELFEWAKNARASVGAAQALIGTKNYDQARGILAGLLYDLDEIAPEEPPKDAPQEGTAASASK